MNKSRLQRPRRGMTVVALLICLILVTLISAAILRVSAAQREFIRAQERRLQAEWLVESGVERCRASLADNREYAGETWLLSGDDLGLARHGGSTGKGHEHDQPAAVVIITVDHLADNPVRRRVRIQADYPPDSPRRARHSKQILIDLEPTKPGVKP